MFLSKVVVMLIIFKNQEGEVELNLRELNRNKESVSFSCIIQHNPFSVDMTIDLTYPEIEYFKLGLRKMNLIQMKELALSSFDRDLVITMMMDSSGHIVASVTVYAGTRGTLIFSFEFDQSFLGELLIDN